MHHRQHAIQHLRDAASEIRWTQYNFSKFLEVNTDPGPSLGNSADDFIYHISQVSHDLVELVAMLGDKTSDLDVIRRKISQPKIEGTNGTLRSLRFCVYFLQFLAEEVNQREDMLALMGRHLSEAWEFTDMAAWHLIDAIREEVYSDPAFAEGA